MKICFQIFNIELSGGTERVCLMIANELAERGYDVTILSRGRVTETFFPVSDKVKVFAMRRNYILYRLRYKTWLTKFLIKRFVRKHSIDIMIDVDTYVSSETIPAIQSTRCKHVAWDHFNFYFCMNDAKKKSVLELIKKHSSRFVVLSRADEMLYMKNAGIDRNLIRQIYNPLTFEESRCLNHTDNVVLAVGRFSYQKGFDLLLKAWQIVEKRVEDWRLEIWGENKSDTGNVHEVFRQLRLKRASLHPATPNIRNQFANASIFVLSSRFEGLGIVLLEASAASLPMISFDCPNGPSEIIEDGVNGYLVEPENIEALAEAIVRMIQDEDGRKRMGQAAYQTSKRYSLESIVNQWESLLNSI